MKQSVIEAVKVIILFAVMILSLAFLASLGEEKPHKVTIDGRDYMRTKEWNGGHYQIILVPLDAK
jgi:hypothetical protein